MSLFYKESVQAKNGSKIPVFNSGRAAHSKYNPEREAESFLAEKSGLLFAVVFGAGAGFHIASLAARNPACKILVVEKSAADLDFLTKEFPTTQALAKNPNVIFCAAEMPGQLESRLKNNYFPAWHGDMEIAALRPWADEAGGLYEDLLARTKEALKDIAADYATQARFGGLWQKNAFCNLRLLKKIQEKNSLDQTNQAAASEAAALLKAAIICAGPSLDKTVGRLQSAPSEYWTIATDTAYKILRRRNIRIDAVVSIDAQRLSAEHFDAAFCKDTIFVLDAAANPSVARYAHENGAKIFFCNCGHPLLSFASLYCKRPFARLDAGGGTVAMAALSFAKALGFERAEIFGADFSYLDGKPYARGSYLDDLYRMYESRAEPAEKVFCSLMFRAPLKKIGADAFQNDLLLSYQKSLENFLGQGNYVRENGVWECRLGGGVLGGQSLLAGARTAEGILSREILSPNDLDFAAFKDGLRAALEKVQESESLLPECALVLPGMARFEAVFGQNKISTKEAKKLALNKILLYNKLL